MILWCLQANTHFQGAIHQAKAWRTNYETTEKELDEAKAKVSALEAKLGSTEADLEEAHAKIVVLNNEKDKGIDAYMLTRDFLDLMNKHDAQRRPEVYKKYWDAAVEAILVAHPEVFKADSFSCPLSLPRTETASEDFEEPIQGDDRSLVGESFKGGRGQKRKWVISNSGTDLGSCEEESDSSSESEEEPAQKKQKATEASFGTSESKPSKATWIYLYFLLNHL